jgi:MoaA/NifB/PqqE/SkfB family radical SAM enzyme
MTLLHSRRHICLYARIAGHVAVQYFFRLPWKEYVPFIRRAWTLLRTFRHNRIVRTRKGYKLQLYLPAYPSMAFFRALENKLLRQPPAPTSIVFSMTRACTYHCPHCYQKKEQGPDISDSLLLDTLKAVHDAGVSFYNIEGGDPFLRFERLLAMLQQLDSGAEIWVNTTGAGVTEERLRRLQQYGLDGIMVSIHSPDPATHDAFTGVPEAFAAACEAIALSKRLGIAVAVNSVLSEQELIEGKLANLMELCKQLQADFVQLIHPKPCGNWLEKQEGMQQNAALLRLIEDQHRHYNAARTAGYPALAAQAFEERLHGMGCTAGAVDRFYVAATGDVQPCEFLQLSFGTVTREPFHLIYGRMRQTFAIPGIHWLCCTQAGAILESMRRHQIQTLPLPWEHTQEILKTWDRGEATPLYTKLGIYS